MKKDWKYILYLTIAFGLYITVKLMEPKQFDWTPTYASADKNPFGGYVLHELLPGVMQGQKISVSNKTLYELRDSLKPSDNLFILTHSLMLDQEDLKILLNYVSRGGIALISSQSFYGKLADTLRLETSDYLFRNGADAYAYDTTYLKFVNPLLDTTQHYPFRKDNIHNYFSPRDSSHATVIAENSFHQPVTIRIHWGKGQLILNSTPLVFTNIYTLSGETHHFVASTLSILPERPTHWTEYYSVGRLEASSPLRFVLTQEPLAWAYYIAVFSLLLFMIFEAKRKQRIIPVIKPLQNTSLEFVGTIGNLYYQRGDHRNIAEKKILFFYDQLRSRYNVNPLHITDEFFTILAGKTGWGVTSLQELFSIIQNIRHQTTLKKEELILLNEKLESFWKKS